MTKLTNPLTVTIATLTYDSLGRVKSQTFPRQGGGTANHNFYFSGYRNIEEDADGSKLVYYFDDKGRLIAEKNQLITNENEYSGRKEYDGQNHIVKVTDGRNYSTNFLYDGKQNLIRATNALTQSTDYIYDAQFHLTDTVDPLLHGGHINYDSENHPTLSKYGIQYNSSFQPLDNGISQASTSYYGNGFPWTTTDGRSIQTTLTYDSYGNPYTSQTSSHPVVKTAYDANLNYQKRGWMTSLTDQVNTTTTFDQYNNRGQLKLKTDPLGKQTVFTYYGNGNLWTRKDRNNNTTTYTYTPTDKIDTVAYPDTSVHFTYNQHDDLTGMQDPLGTTTYAYDAAHRLTSLTNPYGVIVSYSKYDENSNLTEITYPGNKKVTYTYDELNRLKTVTNWLTQTAKYNYDDAGRLTSLTNFNNTVTTYGYDNANRLTTLANKKSDTITILASYSFTLDGNGNRTQTVQNEPLTPLLPIGTTNYGYNPQKNRLLTAGAYSFGYDNEGQLSNGYSATYTFDYEHRLKSIGGTTQFYYDGAGNRVQAVRSGATTRYIYGAGGNLLAEADGNNVITRYYIYGAGLLAMVVPGTPDQVYTYHFNAVGSTIAMTDSSQIIVNKYSYDPFGNISANSIENMQQPFKFVGQYGVMTESNGFYYMRARYYDPSVGRFISEDPIGFGGGINLMAYVGNNPINGIDPSGLYTEVIIWDPVGWGRSSFGHISVNLNGTSYSFSPEGLDVRSADAYAYKNRFRGGVGSVLNLSPEQEAILQKNLENPGDYSRIFNNCVNPVQEGLNAAGLDVGSSLLPSSLGFSLEQTGAVKSHNFYSPKP